MPYMLASKFNRNAAPQLLAAGEISELYPEMNTRAIRYHLNDFRLARQRGATSVFDLDGRKYFLIYQDDLFYRQAPRRQTKPAKAAIPETPNATAMYTLSWIDSGGEATPMKRGSLLEVSRHMRKAGIQFTRRDVAAAQLGEQAALKDAHGRRFTLTYADGAAGSKSLAVRAASQPGASYILAWEYERGATPKTVARGTAAQLVGEMKKRGIRFTRQDFETAAADGATPVYGTAGKYLIIHRSGFVTSALKPSGKAARMTKAAGGTPVSRTYDYTYGKWIAAIDGITFSVEGNGPALDIPLVLKSLKGNMVTLQRVMTKTAVGAKGEELSIWNAAITACAKYIRMIEATLPRAARYDPAVILMRISGDDTGWQRIRRAVDLHRTQAGGMKAAATGKRQPWHFAFTNPATGRYAHATAERINRLSLPEGTPLTPVFQNNGGWGHYPRRHTVCYPGRARPAGISLPQPHQQSRRPGGFLIPATVAIM